MTYPIPEGLIPFYKGCGWALAAVAAGQLVKIVYLADVSPTFDKLMQQSGSDNHSLFFARQVMSPPEVGLVVRELQALGEVSAGMLSGWEFTEL
jgi:hypothetical protein